MQAKSPTVLDLNQETAATQKMYGIGTRNCPGEYSHYQKFRFHHKLLVLWIADIVIIALAIRATVISAILDRIKCFLVV